MLHHVRLFATPWAVPRQAPLSMGILQARTLAWVALPSSSGSSQPRSPTLWADSLPPEPPGKPKSTGVGSLSLLQGIFPTQELNQGFLHCRQILYQLGHLGGPRCLSFLMKTLQFPGLSSTFASLQHPMLQTYECANEPFKSLKIFQD